MSLLNRIVETKRTQFQTEVERGNERFRTSLYQSGIRIIGEVKPRSPVSGPMLDFGRLDEILQHYKKHCAAISVLTDEKFFGGSFELLERVALETQLPVLCKDFIVDTAQIAHARNAGASAVLLIVKILEERELAYLMEEVRRSQMEPVVEINDERELEVAVRLGANVILINNRNLSDMSVSLSTTEKLAPLVPNDKLVISASGISTVENVEGLLPFTNRFLIGSAFMKGENPGELLESLRFAGSHGRRDGRRIAPSVRKCEIKICGITRVQDAELAVEVGAHYIGLIFAERSPRRLTADSAKTIVEAVSGLVKIVGVFQNQDVDFVNEVAETCNLDLVQLHGEESPAYVNQIKRPAIKAFDYTRSADMAGYADSTMFLFDLPKGEPGSTTSYDFELVRSRVENTKQFFLAGGLNSENVRDAIQLVNPYGVDVCSGIESAPGIKSEELMKSFCEIVNDQGRTSHAPTQSKITNGKLQVTH